MSLDKIIAQMQARTLNVKSKRATEQAEGDSSLKGNKVTKSNELSRAYYRFKLNEKRVMESLISKLDSRWEGIPPEVILKAKDYAEAFGLSEKNAYEQLHIAATGLIRKIITVRSSEDETSEYTLLSKAQYDKKKGQIVVRFAPDMAKHLLGLSGKFSSYKMLESVNFSSTYTWRLFELLVSWAQPKVKTDGMFIGWMTVDVDDLRGQLGVPETYRWNMFKSRVLEVAQLELKREANVVVEYQFKKTGRKITHISINFAEDEQLSLL